MYSGNNSTAQITPGASPPGAKQPSVSPLKRSKSATGKPYLRRMKIELGPSKEWKGAEKGSTVSFYSDGTKNGLRVTAQLNSSMMSPAFSTITIYNLSKDTRDSITQGETKVTVYAGWYNSDLVKVFQGSILSVWHERKDTEILTNIVCMSAFGALARGVTSIRFPPGTPLKSAIERLAKDLPGMSTKPGMLAGIPGNIGARGFSYAGSTRGALTKLAEEYGFSWYVNGNFIGALGDDFTIPSSITLTPESGLISVTPILQGPMQIAIGARVSSLYIPGMRAGIGISVSSKYYPKYNGKPFNILQCNVTLDCYTNQWYSQMETRWFG